MAWLVGATTSLAQESRPHGQPHRTWVEPQRPSSAPAQPPSASPSSRTQPLPDWLAIHGAHRTRYETIDVRYTPDLNGGDQQLAFRTRLSVAATRRRVWGLAELEDSRVSLDDSGSRVTASQAAGTRVLQAHAGFRQQQLGGSNVDVQVEVGRFNRDIGSRRLIASPNYRNVSPAFDGVIGRTGSGSWAVQGLYLRPCIYEYPSYRLDDRFRDGSLWGVHLAASPRRIIHTEAFALRLDDGDRAPVDARRKLTTLGARLTGRVGSREAVDYEVESMIQGGRVGSDAHAAGFVHGELGQTWTSRKWRPRVSVEYDQATGDRDPTDGRSGAFDSLFGVRRFELGPSGLYGLVNRSNLRSPGVVASLRPTASTVVTVHHRGVWLDQPRDRWGQTELRDPTGAAGRFVGRQTELRIQQQWRTHLELDAAVFMFREGDFPRRLKPSSAGGATFFYTSLEVRF